MTGTRIVMRLLRATAAVAVLAAVPAGCGSEEPAAPAAPAPTAKPAVTPDPAAGSFPDRPQVLDDFSDPASGWPRAGYREGVYVLSDDQTGAVLAPQKIEPATRGTLTEVVVEPSRGGAGLICRAAPDGGTGYALLLGLDGRVQLSRLQDGEASVIKEFRLTPNERSDRGQAWLLRLGCGTGRPGTPVTIVYAVNATPYGTVVDEKSVDPGPSARVGLVARHGTARFEDFALYLAE